LQIDSSDSDSRTVVHGRDVRDNQLMIVDEQVGAGQSREKEKKL
jgi:hypothetical protein